LQGEIEMQGRLTKRGAERMKRPDLENLLVIYSTHLGNTDVASTVWDVSGKWLGRNLSVGGSDSDSIHPIEQQ